MFAIPSLDNIKKAADEMKAAMQTLNASVGDKLVCNKTAGLIIEGQTYTVSQVNTYNLQFEEVKGMYPASLLSKVNA